jgi:hypothetical protein
VKSKIPVIYERALDVEAGGLMTYGVNLTDLDRRAGDENQSVRREVKG